MKKIVKRVLKISGILLGLVFLVLVIQFYRFSTTKTDAKIYKTFKKDSSEIYITTRVFNDFKYRVLKTFETLDESKPILIFVHGSIGSAMDFERYLKDSDLRQSANLISYDRIGYGPYQTGKVQGSIAFEKAMLEELIKNLPAEKVVLVGYSYGGPVVLTSQKPYKHIVLLAPAVESASESDPWALNLYKWKSTRWLLPKVWQAASIEKISHARDLKNFEDEYVKNPSPILSIHGDEDWIVPIANSYFLQDKLPEDQFEMLTLDKAGHGLVWSRFEDIRSAILEIIN